jgi:hypothetical protein
LARISVDWWYNRVRDKNRRIHERRQAIREHTNELRARKIMMKRKVCVWRHEIFILKKKLQELKRGYWMDPKSVTPDDWAKLTMGQERKLQVIYGKKFPREKWPASIPYLNLIALAKHRAARKARNAEEVSRKKAEELKKEIRNRLTLQRRKPIVEINIDLDDSVAVQAWIRELKHVNIQMVKQRDLICRVGQTQHTFPFEQWQNAVEGTDTLETDIAIAC